MIVDHGHGVLHFLIPYGRNDLACWGKILRAGSNRLPLNFAINGKLGTPRTDVVTTLMMGLECMFWRPGWSGRNVDFFLWWAGTVSDVPQILGRCMGVDVEDWLLPVQEVQSTALTNTRRYNTESGVGFR